MTPEIVKFTKMFLAIFLGILIIIGIVTGLFVTLKHFFGDMGLIVADIILFIAILSAQITVFLRLLNEKQK